MKLIYESGDVVKIEDDERAGNFQDCKVILLQPYDEATGWKVKVYPDEGFAEEDSIAIVDERWFIPNFENLRR